MQNLATILPTNFVECTGGCPSDVLEAANRTDEDYVYTEEEEAELRRANQILTIIWWAEAYVPIFTWYLWRRPGIRAMMDTNSWYHRAWNTMWMSHYFVFQLPAIIALLTFLGNQSINHFAIFLNYWVGTVIGGITAIITTLTFFIALSTFT